MSPPRPLVRVTSGGYIDGKTAAVAARRPGPQGAEDGARSGLGVCLCVAGAGRHRCHHPSARSVDASPIVSIMLVAVMASLASLSDDAAGNALNASHAPAILVVAALACSAGYGSRGPIRYRGLYYA